MHAYGMDTRGTDMSAIQGTDMKGTFLGVGRLPYAAAQAQSLYKRLPAATFSLSQMQFSFTFPGRLGVYGLGACSQANRGWARLAHHEGCCLSSPSPPVSHCPIKFLPANTQARLGERFCPLPPSSSSLMHTGQ